MKSFSYLAILLCLAMTQSCSQSGGSGKVDQKTIDEVTALLTQYSINWANAIKDKDASKVEDYFASDFMYQGGTGERIYRDEFIKGFYDNPNTLKSFEVNDVEVKLYGPDLANVTGGGRNIWIDSEGKEQVSESRFTNVWQKKSGKWQCLIGHGNALEYGPVKPDSEIAADLEQVWKDYVNVSNSGDIDKLMTFFTDDYINMPAFNSTQNGKEETRKFMESFIENSKPTINWYKQSEAFVHENMAYAFGTFEMVFNTGEAAGKPVLQRCITVYKKAADGKWILHRWMGQD